jgi:hypothetical protein
MEFYRNSFGEEMGKEQFMSLQSLIKYNGGLFKSEKQGKFILWKWTWDDVKDSWVDTFVGVRDGFKYVHVDGFLSFGHGGGRGHRPIGYLYELDALGVVRKFRTRHTGDINNGGSSLKSVDLEWERETPAQPIAPKTAPEAPEKVESSSEYVGKVGDRIKGLEVTVTFVKQFESEWGVSTLHKFVDADGNEFTWFSSSKVLELGEKYRMNAGIKKHEEYKEVKQTVLTRCMKIEKIS